MELDAIGGLWDLPWIIAGDFNATKTNQERSRGRTSNFERGFFTNFLDKHGMREFEKSGFTYSYSDKKANLSSVS